MSRRCPFPKLPSPSHNLLITRRVVVYASTESLIGFHISLSSLKSRSDPKTLFHPTEPSIAHSQYMEALSRQVSWSCFWLRHWRHVIGTMASEQKVQSIIQRMTALESASQLLQQVLSQTQETARAADRERHHREQRFLKRRMPSVAEPTWVLAAVTELAVAHQKKRNTLKPLNTIADFCSTASSHCYSQDEHRSNA